MIRFHRTGKKSYNCHILVELFTGKEMQFNSYRKHPCRISLMKAVFVIYIYRIECRCDKRIIKAQRQKINISTSFTVFLMQGDCKKIGH
jgi:hypothetical protein